VSEGLVARLREEFLVFKGLIDEKSPTLKGSVGEKVTQPLGDFRAG